MRWLAATAVLGAISGWCVGWVASEPVTGVLGVVVLTSMLVPLGPWGRRVVAGSSSAPPTTER